MMGFPEGWVDGLSRTAALRCLGNAVVPQVAEAFGRMILGIDESRGKTLDWWDAKTAEWKSSTGNGNGHGRSLAIETQRLATSGER